MAEAKYEVFHVGKGKTGSAYNYGRHNNRTLLDKSYLGDRDKIPLNFEIAYDTKSGKSFIGNVDTAKNLNTAINKRIKQGYKHRNKDGSLRSIRKDATKFIDIIMSGNHEELCSWSREKIMMWAKDCYLFAARHFGGKENIVQFVCHLDEKTPHIHCVTVPITSDGRLSAKDFIGKAIPNGKKQTYALSVMHDDYFAEVGSKYGLSRGERGSGSVHIDPKVFNKQEETKRILLENEEAKAESESLAEEQTNIRKGIKKTLRLLQPVLVHNPFFKPEKMLEKIDTAPSEELDKLIPQFLTQTNIAIAELFNKSKRLEREKENFENEIEMKNASLEIQKTLLTAREEKLQQATEEFYNSPLYKEVEIKKELSEPSHDLPSQSEFDKFADSLKETLTDKLVSELRNSGGLYFTRNDAKIVGEAILDEAMRAFKKRYSDDSNAIESLKESVLNGINETIALDKELQKQLAEEKSKNSELSRKNETLPEERDTYSALYNSIYNDTDKAKAFIEQCRHYGLTEKQTARLLDPAKGKLNFSGNLPTANGSLYVKSVELSHANLRLLINGEEISDRAIHKIYKEQQQQTQKKGKGMRM